MNNNGLTLGVLGGMGPAAPAQKDQEHPAPYLPDGLNFLLDWGADLLCVICNTAHVFVDKLPQEVLSHLVHIVDETIRQCRERSPKGAWLTATLGTMNSGNTGSTQRAAAVSVNFTNL